MCGIAGVIDWRAATKGDVLRSVGDAMNSTLRHRGPDGAGVWVEAEGGVALCQRRLAIIDLGPGGAQPMHSADGRYVITFNGEIYNYRDIRSDLAAAGLVTRSGSDTEVLLEACVLWGVEAAIERAIGMFAFALWDRATRTLVLARDRLGIKPLYYAATTRPCAVRLRAQGAARRAGLEADHRRRCDRRLSAPCLYCAAPYHLPRGLEASSRSYRDNSKRLRARSEEFLGPAKHRHDRAGAQRSGSRRE